MSESVVKPELNNEHRYMALLALTSQQLPEAKPAADRRDGDMKQHSVKHASTFEQLDADPAALESFLRRHTASGQSHRSAARAEAGASIFRKAAEFFATVFAPPAVRYATAFGVTAVAVLLVLQSQRQPDMSGLRVDIARGYAAVQIDMQRSPLSSLVLPWERPPSTIGFAPGAASESRASAEFARGLLNGRQQLAALSGFTSSVLQRIDERSAYAALGEWNVLLWAASESGQAQTVEFWSAQQRIGEKLATVEYDDATTARIVAHLSQVRSLLAALSAGDNPARNARALADELLLFREQLAPQQSPP